MGEINTQLKTGIQGSSSSFWILIRNCTKTYLDIICCRMSSWIMCVCQSSCFFKSIHIIVDGCKIKMPILLAIIGLWFHYLVVSCTTHYEKVVAIFCSCPHRVRCGSWITPAIYTSIIMRTCSSLSSLWVSDQQSGRFSFPVRTLCWHPSWVIQRQVWTCSVSFWWTLAAPCSSDCRSSGLGKESGRRTTQTQWYDPKNKIKNNALLHTQGSLRIFSHFSQLAAGPEDDKVGHSVVQHFKNYWQFQISMKFADVPKWPSNISMIPSIFGDLLSRTLSTFCLIMVFWRPNEQIFV